MAKTPSGVRILKQGATKVSKYGAHGRHVVLDDKPIWCASEAEAQRLEQLIELRTKGDIDNLQAQVPYDIVLNNIRCGTYRADFRYDVIDDRGAVLRTVVEDVKGLITEVFALKRKLIEAQYSITIHEIPAKTVARWRFTVPL